MKLSTFDGPHGVQGWECDKKKCFGAKFGPQNVEKVDFFQKLRSGLAFQGVKMSTFDGPDGVQGWGCDEKSVWGQSLGPKVWKKVDFFSKARIRVRVRVSFSRC